MSPQQQPSGFMAVPMGNVYVPHEHTPQLPPRVKAAMQMVEHFSWKTAKKIAVGDSTSQEFDGDGLNATELNVQSSASKLLCKYFDGELMPDVYDRMDGVVRPGSLMKCMACFPGPAKPDCPVCAGCGKVAVYPVGD